MLEYWFSHVCVVAPVFPFFSLCLGLVKVFMPFYIPVVQFWSKAIGSFEKFFRELDIRMPSFEPENHWYTLKHQKWAFLRGLFLMFMELSLQMLTNCEGEPQCDSCFVFFCLAPLIVACVCACMVAHVHMLYWMRCSYVFPFWSQATANSTGGTAAFG